jgi:hypothetical protein
VTVSARSFPSRRSPHTIRMKNLAQEHSKAEILRRLKDVRPDSVPRWGRMSAHQMVCHLSDSVRMMTGQRPVSDATGLLQRTIVKWIALYLPLPWPAGIDTRPEIDQCAGGGTRPLDFHADVAELEALVALINRPARSADWPPHPIFGSMSRGAWLRWAYVHMDHHLRQFGA